jgi:glycerate kinase
MPLKILISPDKFKGTMTAKAAAEAMARGWRKARPGDSLVLLPISDGGDGFGEVIGLLLDAKVQTVKTIDAASRACRASWWWDPKTKTAVIESAKVIGLAMLPPGRFHPFELDTYGLGAVVKAAAAKGAKHCLMGIGGSATNDGGFGLARSLGWKFLERDGNPIEQWIHLDRLVRIGKPRRRRWFDELLAAVDVQNVLLGRRGATRVYGPQKGLHKKEDFKRAEQCLRQLAQVVEKDLGLSCANKSGFGAGGGLGFGVAAFLGARLEKGFNLFASQATLERHVQWADLVITGEGAIDDSTLMGKGVGEIAQCCDMLDIPCIALAGLVNARARHRNFTRTYALTSLTTIDQAKAKTAHWLERLAQRAGQVDLTLLFGAKGK